MLQGSLVIAVALGYIGLLFVVASYGDRARRIGRGGRWHLIYPLSLAIYCTSWTFFGSVGLASRTGFDFLTIYVGPILMIGLCSPLIMRIVRLAKAQNITSIADFIAARYGKAQTVAATVALIAIIGTIPYIALQLKAVSSSLSTILGQIGPEAGATQPVLADISLFVAFSMATFAVLFGTRHIDATEHQEGLMLAIATESIVKLVAFVGVGVFVTFWMFDGPADLFARALAQADTAAVLTREPAVGTIAAMTLLSLFAIVLLPRQFHVTVVENNSEDEIRRAAWLFPLYLVMINLFVVPIALAGMLIFGAGQVDATCIAGAAARGAPDLFHARVGPSAATRGDRRIGGVAIACRTTVGAAPVPAAPRRLHQRPPQRRLAAVDGAEDFDLRDPLPRLHVLPHGGRRAACLDRAVVLCGDRAARARLLRRPDLAPRHRPRRARRDDGRHPDLGLHAVAAELRRRRHRRHGNRQRGPVEHRLVAAAGAVRVRPAAARARRAVVAFAQHPRLCDALVLARAGLD
jgi:hypothetical protein